MGKTERTPWKKLEAYKGKIFNGEWPTIPQAFAITATEHADRPAFTIYEQNKRISLTFKEAHLKVQRLASSLIQMGILPDDKILLIGSNSPEWAISYLAIMSAGAIVIPLDKDLHTERVQSIAGRTRPKAIFADQKNYEDGLDTLNLPYFSLTTGQENSIGNKLHDHVLPMPERNDSNLAAILFTSGTTGTEKGAMLTHANLISDTFLVQNLIDVYPEDVFYALLPIHHAYCMTAVFLICMTTGAEVVFAKTMAISNILSDLKQAKVTMLMGIPLLYNKIINGIMLKIKARGGLVFSIMSGLMLFSGFMKKRFNINIGKSLFRGILDKASLLHMRVMISGGGPLAPKTFALYNSLGLDFVQGYGLTETSPIITLNPTWHYKETSVGKVLPFTDIKILEPNREEIGEIAVKGPMVFEGYFNDVEATAASFTNDGYFRTGDLGYKDSENYVYITGRQKNIIVTEGGKNVYPEEIEDAFQLNHELDQIMVRGYMANEELRREGIEALIYPEQQFAKDKSQPDLDQQIINMVRTVNNKLASYQQISRIRVLDEPLEMSGTKKIKRFTADKDIGRIIQ